MIKNGHWSLWEVIFIFVRFELNINFFDVCSKNTELSNFMKILLMTAELFHANGRKDGGKGRQA
jgi:hypothetical protein